MAKTSPTQRTLKRLKESNQYVLVKVVERWNSFAKIRQDLWNFDLLCIDNEGNTVAIQVTSKSNMNARIRKIEDSEYTPHLRKANWTLLVEGWYKDGHRWKSEIIDIS